MKLIITNRKEFETVFDNPNLKSFGSKEIHKYAFQKLFQHISVNDSIPIMILQNIDDDWWKEAEFRLKGYKEDVCFYEFYGVIS